MNIKYWYEFKGLDEVLNRVEILCDGATKPAEIKGADSPFSLKYIDVKKLDPVQGSQVSLRLISKKVFQFIDLHTDDMQDYLVRFYRDGLLYWVGWLDSELYSENLADSPPYPVEFSGADFNVMERLKFRDENEKAYTDIATLLAQLKRCFNKLGLPFQKLYIGCSTTPEGITMSASETALHKLYIQSSNFYDEDNEPMTCREVVESILQPFGLMMVQRDASVYIYDYNTVKIGGVMKCYNFGTLAYIGDTAVDVSLGDISDIGTRSTEASLGFEEMINNVTITSSLYGENQAKDVSITEKTVSGLIDSTLGRDYSQYYYSKHPDAENISGDFAVFKRDNESNIEGYRMPYITNPQIITPIFRVRCPMYLIGTDTLYYIHLKIQTYVNTRDNPFLTDSGVKDNANSGTIKLHCNFYSTDSSGKILRYYDLVKNNGSQWVDTFDGSLEQGRCILWLSNHEAVTGSALDAWITNANKNNPMSNRMNIETISSAGKGLNVPTNNTNGYLVFEITNKCRIVNPKDDTGTSTDNLLAENLVKHILVNDISIELLDREENAISTDDYEFKSYVNKKVSSDYDDVQLKCISANEEKAPIGKANILRKTNSGYELQLSYTRAGQTNILERLLMCGIHSNFATKNKVISVDIKMSDNPALRYTTYKNVIQSDGMYITGATLDFHEAKTTIKAVDFSADVAKLSIIPYD